MSAVTFKIAAKTDVGLVRTNNEDNLCVISNLDVEGSTWMNNEVCQLGDKGVLLVVADGMGGMNAGEVASEIAVSYIKERFTHEINSRVLGSDDTIVRFMNDTIVKADNRIKSEGKHRPDAKGMGTTVVIAWLYNGRLYVSWCGDSRAYIYNSSVGLYQITKDHSYVQDLVDKGIVKPEDAFDFPESNVITRCLSHSSMKAEPDNLNEPYIVKEGDIIMLCTDGLSGMIRDNETEAVIAEHTDNMSECADSLIEAAKTASGADNITVCLCQILSVTNKMNRTDTADIDIKAMEPSMENNNIASPSKQKDRSEKHRKLIALLITIIIILLAALGFVFNSLRKNKTKEPEIVTDTIRKTDTITIEVPTVPKKILTTSAKNNSTATTVTKSTNDIGHTDSSKTTTVAIKTDNTSKTEPNKDTSAASTKKPTSEQSQPNNGVASSNKKTQPEKTEGTTTDNNGTKETANKSEKPKGKKSQTDSEPKKKKKKNPNSY